jgi:hypothetical protein
MPVDMSVLGTAPVAAWCPSLDTAGNGTTTLTDLVGGSNGTLTNMVPASDWTDDGSGLWSLDFDGSNDYVALSSGVALGTLHSVSEWVYCGVIPATYSFNGSMGESGSTTTCPIAFMSSSLIYSAAAGGAVVSRTYVVGEWLHVVSIRNGLAVSFYVNGSLLGSSTLPSNPTFTLGRLGARNLINGLYFRGRLDDIRVFDSALTAPGIAYLYASGNGRGVQPATGNPTGILQLNTQSMRLGL